VPNGYKCTGLSVSKNGYIAVYAYQGSLKQHEWRRLITSRSSVRIRPPPFLKIAGKIVFFSPSGVPECSL
jgi:hypothetical protein